MTQASSLRFGRQDACLTIRIAARIDRRVCVAYRHGSEAIAAISSACGGWSVVTQSLETEIACIGPPCVVYSAFDWVA